MSLYQRLRPADLKNVRGQDLVVSSVRKLLKAKDFPHACLMRGPSGVGKTTVARIVARELNCSDIDFCEMNCAELRGIDNVRDIQSRMTLSPFGGDCRIWLIDEAHALTKDAQNALLKMLEDTPAHVYFMLATTDPQKLLPTILTRCTPFDFKPLSEKHLKELILSALGQEEASVGAEVIEKVVEVAEGSARMALVLLEQALTQPDEESQLDAIQSRDAEAQAVEICRALMNPRARWADVAKVVKKVEEDPEKVRRMVLGYFTQVILGGGKNSGRAAQIINSFRDDYFASGRAGLALSAFEACRS